MHNLTSFNIDSHFNKERVKKRVVELNYALKVTIVFEVDCYRKKTHTHTYTQKHTHIQFHYYIPGRTHPHITTKEYYYSLFYSIPHKVKFEPGRQILCNRMLNHKSSKLAQKLVLIFFSSKETGEVSCFMAQAK